MNSGLEHLLEVLVYTNNSTENVYYIDAPLVDLSLHGLYVRALWALFDRRAKLRENKATPNHFRPRIENCSNHANDEAMIHN